MDMTAPSLGVEMEARTTAPAGVSALWATLRPRAAPSQGHLALSKGAARHGLGSTAAPASAWMETCKQLSRLFRSLQGAGRTDDASPDCGAQLGEFLGHVTAKRDEADAALEAVAAALRATEHSS